MKKLCIKATITGKVQGVFFRQSTQNKARSLGLTGWVKNLSNGDVELLACGDHASLMILTEWLWAGPDHAEVNNVSWVEKSWEVFNEFNIIS